jgi:uncharacterized coiled-coil DUF342 family protein
MPTEERVKVLQEIGQINSRAFQMAQQVVDDPSQRAELRQEAAELQERLRALADHVGAQRQVAHEVSESQLDLEFVIEDNPAVSLRLGAYMR